MKRSIFRILIYIGLISRIVAVSISPIHAANDDDTNGKVRFILGDVQTKNNTMLDWDKTIINSSIFPNDSLKTNYKSRCEVVFPGTEIMRIGENSKIQIQKLPRQVPEVTLTLGSIWIKAFMGSNNHLKVRTPTATCAIRGTVYRLTADKSYTNFRVLEGTISVTPMGGQRQSPSDTTIMVNEGEELIIIRDFEQYRQLQEKKYRQYIEVETSRIDEYIQAQQDRDEEFAERQRKLIEEFARMQSIDFDSVDSLQVNKSTFDRTADSQIDWVRWNLDRDKKVKQP